MRVLGGGRAAARPGLSRGRKPGAEVAGGRSRGHTTQFGKELRRTRTEKRGSLFQQESERQRTQPTKKTSQSKPKRAERSQCANCGPVKLQGHT